jgi:hypothetical protein
MTHLNQQAVEFGEYLRDYAWWIASHKWFTDIKQIIRENTSSMTAEEKTTYHSVLLRTAVSQQNREHVREIAIACEIQWPEGL